MRHFIQLLVDFVKFPFQKHKRKNRFRELLQFLLHDYPAYLRSRPSIWRILLFPFLLITVLFNPLPERQGNKKS